MAIVPKSSWRNEWGRCPTTNKRRFPKRDTAKKEAHRVAMVAYKCPHCGDYHLSSQDRTTQKLYKLLGKKDSE